MSASGAVFRAELACQLGAAYPGADPSDIARGVDAIEGLVETCFRWVAAEIGARHLSIAAQGSVLERVFEREHFDEEAINAVIPDWIPRNDPAYEVARLQLLLEIAVAAPVAVWEGTPVGPEAFDRIRAIAAVVEGEEDPDFDTRVARFAALGDDYPDLDDGLEDDDTADGR